MDNNDYPFSEDEINAMVEKYQQSLQSGVNAYFESEELEVVIDYFMRKEMYQEARQALDKGLGFYPENEEIQLLNIHYHILNQHNDTAEKLAQRFVSDFPENADGYLTLASLLSERGLHNEALALLEKAYDIDPQYEPVITAISMEYQFLGQHRKALALYKKLLESNPEDEYALNEIVFVYELTGDISEGIQFLETFTDQYPFNKHAWFHFANALNLNQETEKAIEAYDFALAIDQEFVPALFGKGHSLLFAGDTAQAMTCFREASESETFKAAAFFSMGEVFTQMNSFGSAAEHYAKSIETDPQYNEARLGLANSLFMLGLDEEALKHIDQAIVNDPERAESYHLKGTILMNLERFTESIIEYRNSLRIDKNSDAAWLDLSEAWHFHAGVDEALQILEEASKVLEQENALILYRMAALLFEAGRNQEAVARLIEGLTANFDFYPSIFDYNKSLENNEIISEIVSLFLNQ